MKKRIICSLGLIIGLYGSALQAAEHYLIDTKGMHAFVTFKIKHLGFSWLEGRFNRFSGSFEVDKEHPENNRVAVSIDIASLDTNHAERDKHLRSERFFDSKQFPKAHFKSTGWRDLDNGTAVLSGDFTLRGVTRPIEIQVEKIGAGEDPWGGYRMGFVGTTALKLSDYKMKESAKLGPAAEVVNLWLSIEGIRE